MKIPEGTLGAALRERRWARGLEQKDVAAEIGTTLATYRNWEWNKSVPTLKYVTRVIAFLGYDWRRAPTNFGGEVRRTRTALGMSTRQLAGELQLSADTIEDLERGRRVPSRRIRRLLDRWLGKVLGFTFSGQHEGYGR